MLAWAHNLQHWWHRRKHGELPHVRAILERRSLDSVFQPMVDLRTGAIIGHEALSRTPAGSADLPFDSLLGAAKEQRCQSQLELACLDYAIGHWLAGWGKGKLFSNISAKTLVQLHQSHEMDSLLQVLRQHKVQPTRLGLDISGYSRMLKIELLVDAIEPLRAAGITIALDDFKATHNSMGVWSKVRPDIVKLSSRWTRNLPTDPGINLAIGSLVRTAKKLNCALLAKSVESENELRAMRQLGVGLAQGHFLGHPAADPVMSLNLRAYAALAVATH